NFALHDALPIYPLAVTAEGIPVHPGLAVIPLPIGLGRCRPDVLETIIVLREKSEVVVSPVAPIKPVVDQVGFDSEDRLDSCVVGLLAQVGVARTRPVVRHGDGKVTQSLSLPNHLGQLRQSVERGKLTVDVQMHKTRLLHGPPSLPQEGARLPSS